MNLRWAAIVCLLCMGVSAQQQKPQPGVNQQGMGTVGNDRNSTMPQVGATAHVDNQNELVGCVRAHGQELTLTQPRQRRTYKLQGNQAALQNSVGKMVKVTGRLVLGRVSAFQVEQVTPVQDKCEYESTANPLPATGKAGVQGTAETVTSTRTVEQVTPGAETKAGIDQNPRESERAWKKVAPKNPQPTPTASQAAPPDPNVQNPDSAQRIANAAQQPQLSNPKAELGVNAQPNYSTANNPQANAHAVSNQARQNRGQASGSEQVFKGGEKQVPSNQSAQGSQTTAPVFAGCLTQDGKNFWLVEQGSNERFHVEGDTSKLKDHVNHKVQIVGNKTGTYGPSIGTSGGEATVHLQAIQDIDASCGKP